MELLRIRSHDSIECWGKRFVLAAILALLGALAGCSEGTTGLKWSVTLQGSPLGIAINCEPVPTFGAPAPAGWVASGDAIAPASQPATAPAQ